VAYYDYATNDSANWGPTTLLSSTATSVKFVRTTSDGIWQLTQTITELPATAQSPASAKVTMALKNLTGVPRTAYLMRFADMVVTRWTVTGTHTGNLGAIPATGRRVSVTGISCGRVENGKMVEAWTNWDTLGMMQQLGVLSAAAQQAA